MTVGLLLCAVAALGLGLLTSAAVGNVAQATLALPMLCFPAVLFAGAILPGAPHGAGRRRAQRGDAVALGLRGHRPRPRGAADPGARRLAARPSAARVVRQRGHASTGTYWLVLAAFASCSSSRPGACSSAAHGARRAERRTNSIPTHEQNDKGAIR